MSYWNYEIKVGERCVMSSGGKSSLSETISEAIASAIYYKAVYPDDKITIASITECCDKCHNNKTIVQHRPRSTKTVKCPVCKGEGAPGRMDNIAFVMPDPANRITITQA